MYLTPVKSATTQQFCRRMARGALCFWSTDILWWKVLTIYYSASVDCRTPDTANEQYTMNFSWWVCSWADSEMRNSSLGNSVAYWFVSYLVLNELFCMPRKPEQFCVYVCDLAGSPDCVHNAQQSTFYGLHCRASFKSFNRVGKRSICLWWVGSIPKQVSSTSADCKL